MAVTSVGSGTQTATIDTEHTLDTETTAGVYQLVVDTSNLVNGDVVEFNIYTKYASGGTSRLAFPATYAHAQGAPNKYSPPVPIDTEIIAKLKQTDGTGRDFYWNLLYIGTSVTSVGSGTQTATIDTEHTLDTETTAGTYILVVDTANMVNGDVVTFRFKTKYASGGTSRLVEPPVTYANAQSDPNKYSFPIMVDTEIIATLEQTDGTGRDFPWNLLKVG